MSHLNKVLKTGLIIIGTVVVSGATLYGSIKLGNRLSQKCASGQKNNHMVTIEDDIVTPENTEAPLCDTLTITNLDDKSRFVAFGLHEEHEPYDGVEEKLLKKDESFTVTLVETGNFRFHDHAQDEVQGTFTVIN